MSKALYRKYRSRRLNEVIGQDHITVTLTNALKNNQISHAYLLTGPRGVGKTSVARILAHEINKLPYDEEKSHLDIIEIDAASNRRIDEIRDLREKSRLAPTSAPYKVYIIDEVHMLTKEAFNALLKTLEEPPAHVVFILATTELHKLPATIISRTQRFAFRPINHPDMTSHLKDIAMKENIKISDEAIDLIAIHANGGFRDGISLLDQIKNTADEITIHNVETVLGRPATIMIQNLLNTILNGDIQKVYEQLESLYNDGYSSSIITESLLQECQRTLRMAPNTAILGLLELLLKVEVSINKNIALEVALIKSIGVTDAPVRKAQVKIIENPEITAPPKDINQVPQSNKKPKNSTTVSVSEEIKKPASTSTENFDATWNAILLAIKSTHNTLYGILNNSGAVLSEANKSVVLTFRFPFHLKKASEMKNQEIIKDAIFKETFEHFGLLFKKQDKESVALKKTVSAIKDRDESAISAVIDVFGGGEVINK